MDKVHKFIRILFEILQVLYIFYKNEEHKECITWTPSGEAFVITNRKLFARTVMGENFKTSKLQSFFRQLNQYSFKMVKNQSNYKEYSHKWFMKDNPTLLIKIKRKSKIEQKSQEESLHVSSLRQANDQLKSQLEFLKIDQQQLAKQLRINCIIQQRIMSRINLVAKKLNDSLDEELIRSCQRPMFMFFELVKGYQPDLKVAMVELMQEEYLKDSPLSVYQNSPLLFPFF